MYGGYETIKLLTKEPWENSNSWFQDFWQLMLVENFSYLSVSATQLKQQLRILTSTWNIFSLISTQNTFYSTAWNSLVWNWFGFLSFIHEEASTTLVALQVFPFLPARSIMVTLRAKNANIIFCRKGSLNFIKREYLNKHFWASKLKSPNIFLEKSKFKV